jgi:peptide/nickel transport system permease protein
MTTFILRRVLAMIPLVLGVTALAFILQKLSPGDFLTPIRAQRDINVHFIEALSKQYGLDRPWYEQYGRWLWSVLHGDFGYSWSSKVQVVDLLKQRLPNTLLLNIVSLTFAWVIALPLGVLAAIYQDSIFDRISAFLAYAALSLPEFLLGLLAMYFAAQTGWFPIGGKTSIEHDFLSPAARFWDVAYHLILPSIVLGIGGIAGMMRLMRANFLETIRAEFVLTARAKGLPEGVVMFRHVLRNAMNPFLSSFGYTLSGLFSGSLLVETVMNYPGIGQLLYQSVLRKDTFVVLGSVVMGSVVLVLGNLVSDLLLAWSDPRIRLGGKS